MPAVLSLKVEIDTDALDEFDKRVQETEARVRSLSKETERSTKVVRENGREWEDTAASLATFSGKAAVAGTKAVAMGVALTKAQRSASVFRFAVVRIGAALLRISGPIAVATVAVKTFTKVLDVTGKQAVVMDNLTAAEKRAAQELIAINGQSVERLKAAAAAQGKTLQELGIGIESNLDRIKENTSDFGSRVIEPIHDASLAVRDWWNESNIFLDVWKNIDRRLTIDTKEIAQNFHSLGDGLDNVRGAIVEAFGQESQQQFVDSAKAVRELRKEHERLDEIRARTADDFERIKKVNAAREERLRIEEKFRGISGLDSTAAIDARINKELDLSGIRAANDRGSESAARELAATLEALDRRRFQVTQGWEIRIAADRRKRAEERKRTESDLITQSIQRQRGLFEAREAREKIFIDLRDKLRLQESRDFTRGLLDGLEEEKRTAEKSIKNAKRKAKELRLISEAEFEFRKGLIRKEADASLSAATNDLQRRQVLADLTLRIQQESFAQRRRLRQLDDNEQRRQAQQAVKTERDKIDALKKLSGEGKPGGFAAQLAGSFSRRDIIGEITRSRAKKEGVKGVKDIRSLRGRVVSEARRGEISPARIAQAQANLGKFAIEKARADNKLDATTFRVIDEQLRAANQQATLTIENTQKLEQLQAEFRSLADGIRNAGRRTRAQNAGLR